MKVKIPITTNALCVDASCTGNPGLMEYRAVDLKNRKEVFHSPIYPMGTNNIGEFLALYDAIRYIESTNKKAKKTKGQVLSSFNSKEGVPFRVEDLGGFNEAAMNLKPATGNLQQAKPLKYECIFTDSETAIARMRSKKIKTTLKYTEETKELLNKVQEAITWVKTHDFTIPIRKRETEIRGEIPADFDRK